MKKATFFLIVCLMTVQMLPIGNMVQRAYGTCGGPHVTVTPKIIQIDPAPTHTPIILSGEGARAILEQQHDRNRELRAWADFDSKALDYTYKALQVAKVAGIIAEHTPGGAALKPVGTMVRTGVFVKDGGPEMVLKAVSDGLDKVNNYLKNVGNRLDAGMRDWANRAYQGF